MALDGMKLLCLESRRADDLASLFRRQGADVFVAPSVRERGLEEHSSGLRLVEALEAGEVDVLVCMTGVGLGFLRDVVAATGPVERLAAAMRRVPVLSRGSKPIPLLRTFQVPVAELIPEPNTWREVVAALGRRVREFGEKRIAIQEYGRPNAEMYAALEAMDATVMPFALYRWELPEDIGPLRKAVEGIVADAFAVIVFTSSIQLDHLLEVAGTMGHREAVEQALRERLIVASIGPVMTDWLRAAGYPPHIEPQSPKMGALVKAVAEEAPEKVRALRGGA
jgi:uroporphyrinogen-III synthase